VGQAFGERIHIFKLTLELISLGIAAYIHAPCCRLSNIRKRRNCAACPHVPATNIYLARATLAPFLAQAAIPCINGSCTERDLPTPSRQRSALENDVQRGYGVVDHHVARRSAGSLSRSLLVRQSGMNRQSF